LQTVTYPGVAAPTRYQYGTTDIHLYESGTDPRNKPLPVTEYYTDGRLKGVTDALGKKTGYAYNTATNTTTITYPADDGGYVGTATFVYDNYGKLLTSKDPLEAGDPGRHTTTYLYDPKHNLTSVTDPLNHTTSYTYDDNGNRTSVTYPVTATSTNTTSHTEYNAVAEPRKITDELGQIRNFSYDQNFWPKNQTDTIDGQTATAVSYTFNANGTMQAKAVGYDLTVTSGKATTYTYDAYGNLASETDPLGQVTTYTYDALGRRKTITPPIPAGSTAAAITTTYTYDALGRVLSINAPQGRVTTYTYDGNGNKLTETLNGHTTTYEYDELNRLSVARYPTLPETTKQYSYDFRNNIINITDELAHVTHHEYDLAGRLMAKTMAYGTADASRTTYTYYNDGRKHTETDANNHTMTYVYR
jgi:YD repeat-containing protein